MQNLLQGQRVRLTALTAEDLPTMRPWFQDAEFMRLFDAQAANPKGPGWLEEWFNSTQKATDGYYFAIRRVEDEALIGYIELDGILWPHQVAWFSIGIGERACWGQGYGAEAARLTLDFAFRELNLYRVQATVFSYNTRSQALFERLGFRREGAFREFLCRDGQRHDMLLFGLLRPEYQPED